VNLGVVGTSRRQQGVAYEYGPGAMLGERAHLEGGTRTSSLIAVTDCRVASVPAESFDRESLQELSTGHRREDSNAG
jgi:CRP-like cAMP-binding protein